MEYYSRERLWTSFILYDIDYRDLFCLVLQLSDQNHRDLAIKILEQDT